MTLRSIIVGGILLVSALAQAQTPLPPDGQVVDLAGVLDTPSALQLSSSLSSYVDATGLDLGVVTVTGLDGESLPEYARRVLQARSASHPRVAILVWAPPQQLAIAVSAASTDDLSIDEVQQVLDSYALPGLRSGRAADALLQSVFALMVAAGEPADATASIEAPIIVHVDAAPIGRRTAPVAAAPQDAGERPLRDPAAEMTDLGRELAGAPGDALTRIWEAAGTQAGALLLSLRDLGAQLDAHFSGDAAMHPDRMALTVAGLIVALFVLVIVVRVAVRGRNPAMALSIAGLAAAAACWLLAGFLELALLLAAAGPLLWGLLRLLPLLFARNDQERLPTAGQPPRPMTTPQRPLPSQAVRSTQRETMPATPKPAAPASQPASATRQRPDITVAIERAHRDGIRTPALDHLIAQKGRPGSAQRQKQRQYWLIALFVCFFVAFPLVFVLLIAWALSELNRIKPPQQKLPDFVRQLLAELRVVSQHHKSVA
jgi:hypothetical protein